MEELPRKRTDRTLARGPSLTNRIKFSGRSPLVNSTRDSKYPSPRIHSSTSRAARSRSASSRMEPNKRGTRFRISSEPRRRLPWTSTERIMGARTTRYTKSTAPSGRSVTLATTSENRPNSVRRRMSARTMAASKGEPARLRRLFSANLVSESVPPSTRTVPTGRPARVTIRSSAPAKEEQSSKIRMRDATDMWEEDTPHAGSTEPQGGNHPQGKENHGHGAQSGVLGRLRRNPSHRLRSTLTEAGF